MSEFFAFVAGIINSAFFSSAVTLGVGLFAFVVYRRQKIDQKRDAANIILLEIKNAENHLNRAKDMIFQDGVLPETIFVMKDSNWNKYSYLFVRDFTDVEWGLINTFYEKCRQYDEALDYDNSFYKAHVDGFRDQLQSTLAQYTMKYVENVYDISSDQTSPDTPEKLRQAEEKYQAMLEGFATKFREEAWKNDSGYYYYPRKAFEDGKAIISTIKPDLSTSTIGIKLENIINQTARTRFAEWIIGYKPSGK